MFTSSSTRSSRRTGYSLACLALVLPLAVGAVRAADSEHSHDDSSKSRMKSSPSMQMHHSMMDGMKGMQGMKPSGDVDYDFAMMMRKHHAMAVEMSQQELHNGKDQQMRDMATKIIESQKKEIAAFDEWMKSHKPSSAGAKPKIK